MMYRISLLFIAFVDLLSGTSIDGFTYSSLLYVGNRHGVDRIVISPYSSQFGLHVDDHTILHKNGVHMKNPQKWDDEIDKSTIRRVQTGQSNVGNGLGETAAGAVLGGLLLGPFGMFFFISSS
jgi:hypothetical protein